MVCMCYVKYHSFACSVVMKELVCAYLISFLKHSLDFKAKFILFNYFLLFVQIIGNGCGSRNFCFTFLFA